MAGLKSGTARIVVRRQAVSDVEPQALFGLVKDCRTWPAWTLFRSSALERVGFPDPNGVGSIRVFRTVLTTTREEVVAIDPDRKLTYRLLSGLPLSDYVADVELELTSEGRTLVTWSASFGPQPWGTRTLWRLFIDRTLARTCADLARANLPLVDRRN